MAQQVKVNVIQHYKFDSPDSKAEEKKKIPRNCHLDTHTQTHTQPHITTLSHKNNIKFLKKNDGGQQLDFLSLDKIDYINFYEVQLSFEINSNFPARNSI